MTGGFIQVLVRAQLSTEYSHWKYSQSGNLMLMYHKTSACAMDVPGHQNTLWKSWTQRHFLQASRWREKKENFSMSTPPCHLLELRAQCLHCMLELSRGVKHSLPALEEAGKDRSSLGMTHCNQKPCRFVSHISLCCSKSEREKISLCWWKWLENSLVYQIADGFSRGKSRRSMACFM